MQPKFIHLLVLLSFTSGITYCQETQRTKVYEIRNSIAVFPCSITGKSIYPDDRFSSPPFGAKFMVVRPLNSDSVIIRYLLWNKKKDSLLRKYYNEPFITGRQKAKVGNDSSSHRDHTSLNPLDTINFWPEGSAKNPGVIIENYGNKMDKYFRIARYDLDSNCIMVYNAGIRSIAFTIGLVTMPLKLRLGRNFDFQGNLSLGSTAGIKLRLSKYNANFVNFLLGTSISTVSLDSFSTKGKVSGQPLTNIAVFSPSLGAVFEFGKAQAGIFLGWDFLNKSTQSQYTWIYNKKPWISIGFGFSVLNIDSKSDNSQSKNQ